MKLLGRREIMAYAFAFTDCALALLGKISAETFGLQVGVILAFYFGMRKGEGEK
jgi:hypothetical protein